MAARKFGNPVLERDEKQKEYRYTWTMDNGDLIKVPFAYKHILLKEYHQDCTADYPVEDIGAPGGNFQVSSSIRTRRDPKYGQLVTVWEDRSDTWHYL